MAEKEKACEDVPASSAPCTPCPEVVNVSHVTPNQLREGNPSTREALFDLILGGRAALSFLAFSLLSRSAWLGLAPLVVKVRILYVHVCTAN